MTQPESIPKESLSNGEILRELYHRFKVATLERSAELLDEPFIQQMGTRESPRFRAATRSIIPDKFRRDVYRMLKARYAVAKQLWVPGELERRRAGLADQALTEQADGLVELRPDAAMIRLLFDHPSSLPTFDDRGGPTVRATPFDALTWLHFELYPDLRRRFSRADFPPADELPETILGTVSADPAGTMTAQADALQEEAAAERVSKSPAVPAVEPRTEPEGAKPAVPGKQPRETGTESRDPGWTPNRIAYDPSNPDYYANKEAIKDALKAQRDHTIEELLDLDPDKLKKLLRSPRCQIRYMSGTNRGRVHRSDWARYLNSLIEQERLARKEAERALRDLGK